VEGDILDITYYLFFYVHSSRERFFFGKSTYVYVNSKKDTRASEDVLRTHDNVRFDCIKTNSLEEVDFSDVDVIAIDEAQFFTGLKTFRRVIMGSNISIWYHHRYLPFFLDLPRGILLLTYDSYTHI